MLNRRQLLVTGAAGGALVVLSPVGFDRGVQAFDVPSEPGAGDSAVLRWNGALLEAVRENKLGPPMVSRALAMCHTAMFDAWAAYDAVALGTQLGDSLRRPASERTHANRVAAISYAAYRTAVDLFPASASTAFDPLMRKLGLDVRNVTMRPGTPAGVGNAVAAALLEFRHHDGSNQLGDEPGGTAGVAYSDYTGYKAVNLPLDISMPFDHRLVRNPSRWQPLTYANSAGETVTPAFMAPHWQRVRPFSMKAGDDFRSATGPATLVTGTFVDQARALVVLSASLTDREKMIAEYWADGPKSELPPGHWNLFAQFVSRRDRTGRRGPDLDHDVKLFFALTNAVFDAGICAWDSKRAFDSVRPLTAVRYLLAGQRIHAWGGPGKGTKAMRGEEWFPYQGRTFPTPPFAEYPSGHSTFSAAAAEVLRLFTGSDRLGASVTLPAGSSLIEPGITPARPVTLHWRTFSDAADEAGMSRRYGGIHFRQGDLDARKAGRLVGAKAFGQAMAFARGGATARS